MLTTDLSGKKSSMTFLKKLSPANFIVLMTLICAFFFYFWNIHNTVQFQGDQGRDALIVSDIFRNKNLVFIGPVTSVGNMYLGPLYYYFMLPFLFITYPNPLGPVFAIGVLSLIAVFMLYHLGKKMFSTKTAVLATVLFGFSSVIAMFSRFSWNPNPAPIVALLLLFSTYKAWVHSPKYWMLASICFSILLQLHYLTLLTLGGVGIIWLVQLFTIFRKDTLAPKINTFVIYSCISLLIFVISLTPLILFDLKHDFLNINAFQSLFTKESVFTEENNPSFIETVPKTVKEMHGRALFMFYDLLIGKNTSRNTILLIIELAFFIYLFKKSSTNERRSLIVIMAFLIPTLIGISFYKSNIFPHYIIYILPAVVLYHGFVLSKLKSHFIVNICLTIFISAYIVYNVKQMPLESIDWTIKDIQETSQTIYNRVQPGEKYNIVLLSGSGDIDGQNYRYFLSATDRPPLPIERQGETETLFIINEDKKISRVIDSPIYEIVVFPDKEVKEVYTSNNGPEITVLRK